MGLKPGDSVGGWTLGRSLGAGATAEVFAAERNGERVAVKLLHRCTQAQRARLAHEARALMQLRHPGVVGLLAAQLDAPVPYLVMNHAPGRPLSTLLRTPPVAPGVAADIVCQLAEALRAAHAAGVFHRDVKPANALLGPDGTVVLVDFGSVKVADVASLTATGERAPATLAYVPPEWFAEACPPDVVDRYALGVVLHELLTGARAYASMGVPELQARKRTHALDPQVHPQLDAVVRSMTDPDPQLRPDLDSVVAQLRSHRTPAKTPRTITTLAAGAAPEAHPPHELQLGRYTLLGELGRGGMGVVWRAHDPELEREVAIKITGAHEARLRQEALVVARLDHRGIVRLLDVGTHADQTFLVMELVDGPDLRTVMAEQPQVSPRQAATWIAEAGRALGHAHALGLVHRDVKPANLLLERVTGGPDRLRLTDFGLVADLRRSQRLTKTGQMLGTPAYMAPEQIEGGPDAVSPAADVYALGVVLFELLSGQLPYEGGHPAHMLHMVLHHDPSSLQELAPSVPGDLQRICAAAMSRDRADRYADGNALAADLDRFLRGEPVQASDPTPLRRAHWWLRRNRRWVRGVALGLGSAAALGSALWAGVWMLEQRAWSVREREATERLHTLEQRLQAAQTADPSLTAAFEQFAQLDAHQGTRALARGWQRWGDWHRARGDVAAARTALARAYALSPTEAGRRDALAALTRLAREQGDWNGVGALLDQLGPQGVRQAGLGAVASEFAYVDFGGSDDTPLDAAPVLEALRTGVHTHLEGAPAFHWLPEPFVQRDDQLLPLDRSPQLTAASTQPWPLDALHDHALFWIGGESGLVAAGSAHNPGGVYQLTPEGPQQQLEWGASRLRAAWSGDLDDDGRTETFLAFGHYGRRLALLRQGADGWALTSPDPVLDASASAIQDLAVADLDGDGLRELVVATGTWGTADVRVYRLEGDALRLLARDKLGQTEEVAVLPRSDGTHAIVALRAFDWPMPKVFGGEAQSGAPLGLHVLTFDGARLQRLAHHPTAEANRLSVGDYDGDGLADLALTVDPSELHVFRQMPDGQLARGVFRGTALVNRGSPDLDGDGDAELLVRTAESGRIWVAGTGTTQLAHRTAPDVAPRVEPPPGLSAGLHQTWIRADELRILGMWQAAEEQLRSLAELAPDRDQQAAVLLQAATIAEEGADQQDVAALLRAADLYDRAAEHPDHFRDATLGAARCFEALLQTDDALARLQRLPRADPGRARISVLEGQRVEPIEVSLDPGAPGLQILEPLHARYLQGGGLALDLAAADTVVARLPVHWDGARFGVEVEIDADAVEWDSGVSVHLDSDDAPLPYPAPGLEFSGYGGAGHTRLAVTYGYRWSGYQQSDVPVGQRPQHIRARLDDFVSAIGYRVDLDGLQPEPMAWIKRFRDGEARPTGRYDLRLVSRGQRFRGRITALRIWGVTPQPLEPTTPVQAARDALATGRPADALAALRSVPPGVEREHLRIVALDDLDQGETLEAEVQRLLRRRSDAARAELARLLRIRGDRVGPILSRRLDHESWLRLFWKTFATVLHMHPESPAATDAATRVLGVVREDEVRDRQLAVDVLVARADAWRRLGRLAAASDHLERARVVAEELTGSRLATVHLERARLAMENGRTEHAMASLQAALASSPAPPLLADMIVADPVFAPLASRAEWDASVVAARRLSSSR